jgi:hypothetical protein
MNSISEHKAAILELIGLYSGAVGRKNSAELAETFTDDCQIDGIAALGGYEEPIRGKKQLAEYLDFCWKSLGWIQQLNTTTDVKVMGATPGATATAVTNLIEMAPRSEGGMLTLIGRYHDELVLTKAGWRFRKRRLEVFEFRTIPA